MGKVFEPKKFRKTFEGFWEDKCTEYIKLFDTDHNLREIKLTLPIGIYYDYKSKNMPIFVQNQIKGINNAYFVLKHSKNRKYIYFELNLRVKSIVREIPDLKHTYECFLNPNIVLRKYLLPESNLIDDLEDFVNEAYRILIMYGKIETDINF